MNVEYIVKIKLDARSPEEAERIAAHLKTVGNHHGASSVSLWVNDPISGEMLLIGAARSMAELDAVAREEEDPDYRRMVTRERLD